jgi:hypothetical protein
MKMFNMNRYYELISAFQKSIRWCEINDSRYFAQQLMVMGYPGAVFNRLILIAAEDVGIADPSLILYERGCSDNFENLIKQYGIKKREAVKFPKLCEVVDRAVIAAAISYKSRLLPMASFATLFDIYRNENFSENVTEYLNRFAVAVKNKNEKQALYYAYVTGIFLNSKDRILTWVQRQSGKRNEDLIQKWVEEYKKYNELLVLAGVVVMLCRDLGFNHGEYKDGICQYFSFPIKEAIIPDCAYDRHTRAGKRRGRGLEHFFNEGASVKNERFPNDWEQTGRDAYIRADKIELGKASKIIEAIKEKL